MKKIFYITLLFLGSCASFQQVQLEQIEPTSDKLMLGKMPSSNVLLINNTGIVDNFNSADFLWNSNSKNIFIDALNGQLRLKADSIGKPQDYIYREFNPLNFKKAGKVIVTMSEGYTRGLKTVDFLLVDDDTIVLKLPLEKISPVEYHYTIPEKKDSLDINFSRIIQLCIRPIAIDSTGFSGILNIDEIKVVK